MAQAQQQYAIRRNGETKEFETQEQFHSTKSLLDQNGVDYEIVNAPEESDTDSEEPEVRTNGGKPNDEPEPKSKDVEIVNEQEAAEHDVQQSHAQNLAQVQRDNLQDPLENVPSWMLTEIQHGRETSIDLNKRGTQVIAAALDLVVEAECEIAADETDFEYSRYRATVTDADDNVYNAVGDCHINEQGKDKWDLERMAETRAKKRAVKWATAGGLEALLENSDD